MQNPNSNIYNINNNNTKSNPAPANCVLNHLSSKNQNNTNMLARNNVNNINYNNNATNKIIDCELSDNNDNDSNININLNFPKKIIKQENNNDPFIEEVNDLREDSSQTRMQIEKKRIESVVSKLTEQDDDINFLFIKLDNLLKSPFINYLKLYTIENLKKYDDENIISSQHETNISILLNEVQVEQYKRVKETFELFYDKYFIREKLKNNSKLLMLKIVLDSIKTSPKDFVNKLKHLREVETFQQQAASNSSKTQKDDIIKNTNNEANSYHTPTSDAYIFIKQLTQEKIQKLKSYREKLEKDLDVLKEEYARK